MSYYAKRYPVLERTEWRLDGRDELREGILEDATLADNGPQVMPGRQAGVYVSPVIDAGQAVAWNDLSWEADLPLGSGIAVSTRFGATEDELQGARWSAAHKESPFAVSLQGSRETHADVAAARYLQVRAEMAVGIGGTPTLRCLRVTAGLVPPACVGPMNFGLVENGQPVFYWTRVEGAAAYHLEISVTSDFSDAVYSRDDLADTCFVYPGQIKSGTYYWRVRAVDGTGQVTDFSAVRHFRVGERPHANSEQLRHPYLFFTAQDIPEIRQGLKSRHSAALEAIAKRADEALSADLRDEKDILLTPGQHSDFHPLAGQVARGQLESLAFMWIVTGNERYAAKAREIVLHLAGLSRWTGAPFGDPNSFYPVWQAALETGMICKGVATAYDWLYDYLPDDDRARVREGLMRLGVLPIVESWADPKTIRHIPRHQIPAGNWWSVCNSGGGIGALAMLGEVQDAERWVDMIADAIRAYLCYPGGDNWNVDLKAGWGNQYIVSTYPNWGEDGGYVESIGYAAYGLVNAMYFVDALKRVTGEDLTPFINPRVVDYPYYCLYTQADGSASTINFNDSGGGNFPDELYALLAKHTRSGRSRYLLEAGYPARRSIHAVLADDETVQPEPPDLEKRNKLFGDIGWCVFRSGWEPDSSLMAAKFTHGRGHQDIGQFVIHYKGRPFVVDPGVISYADPIYQQHLSTSRAHNLVLVDDECQMRVDGKILGYTQAPGIGLVEADLTAAYQDRITSWIRTLIYLEPECFVIVDRLSADTEHVFSWEMHPNGKVAVQPGLGATIYQDEYEMQLRLLSPSRWRVNTKDGYIGANAADYVAFTPEKPCREVMFVAVLTGGERGRNVGVGMQESNGGLGIRVTTAEASQVILVRSGGEARMSAWDVTAEASICAVIHSKGEPSEQRRWVIAGKGPFLEGVAELAEASLPGDYRAGVHRP